MILKKKKIVKSLIFFNSFSAFSTEFVSYYLERNIRMKEMKNTISTLMDTNKEYLDKQQELHEKYAKLIDEHTENVKKQ